MLARMAACFVSHRNAVRACVSRPLVSIVFRDQPGASEETRARVRAAAAEIGYRPDTRAQLLSRKQTRLIGVSVGVGHEFHAELVTELYAAAQASGYELVLSGVTPDRRNSAPRRTCWRSGGTR
jgi:DNA-binding LacI/PurR family transcriptional regulator